MLTVNLDKQLKYMYGLERFGIRLGLETMEQLMRTLGNPHQKFPSVHITGTVGKGSAAAMIESVLREQGLTTALYTSPHLFRFNERIRLGGKDITDKQLAKLISAVRIAVKETGVSPTFFEFTTTIAFLHFAEKKPDIAIVEVGMGGLLDATNVITPLVSVITNIGLDHTFLLGQTREAIALNKAGIIKPGVPVVIGEVDEKIQQIFHTVADQKESPLRGAHTQIHIESLEQNQHSQTFRLKTPIPRLRLRKGLIGLLEGLEYTLPLIGDHQRDNVAIVLTVLDELDRQGITVTPPAVLKGLATTYWPGRLQIVSEKPCILVDGAHNPPSLHALIRFLTNKSTKPSSLDVLVVGVKKDKDLVFLRQYVAPLFKHIITTEGSYEPLPAHELAQYLGRGEVVPDPAAATQRGLALAGDTGSLVITGSLYMIPAALEYLSVRGYAGQAKPLSS